MQKLDDWLFGWLEETIDKDEKYGVLKAVTTIGVIGVAVGVAIGMMLK